ncbi:MAG: hypothetical protein GXO87_07290 [Chlorobi bacterium]|nr:hypothetical protein [Chlorobiota bacterium]
MKKMINLLAISLLVIFFGCSSGNGSYYDDEYSDVESVKVQNNRETTAVEKENATAEDKYLAPEESSSSQDLNRSDYSTGNAAYDVGEGEYRDTTTTPIVDDKYFDDEGNEVQLEGYESPIDDEVIGSGYRRYFEYYYPTVVTVDYAPSYYDPYYYDPYYYSPGWSFSFGFGGYYGGWGWGISWGGYYPPYYNYYQPYYGYYPPYYGYYPPYYCDPYYGDGYYGYVPSDTRYRDNYNGDLRDNRGGRGADDLTRTSGRTRDVGLDGLAVSSRGGGNVRTSGGGRAGGRAIIEKGKGNRGEIGRTYATTAKNRDLDLASIKAERREAVARGTDKRGNGGTTKTKKNGYSIQSTKGSRNEVAGVSGKGGSRSGGKTVGVVSSKPNRGEVSSVGRTGYSKSSNRVPKDHGRVTSSKTTRKASPSRNSVESYYSKNKRNSSSVKSSSRYTTGTYKRSSSGISGSSRKSTRSGSSYSSSSRKAKSSSSVSSSRSSSRKSSSKSYSAPSRKSSKSYSSPSRSGSRRSSSYKSSSSSRSHSSYGSRSSGSHSSSGSRSSGSRSSGSRGSSGGGRRR